MAAVDKFQTYFEVPDNNASYADHTGRYHRVDFGPVTMLTIDSSNGGTQGTATDTNFFLDNAANPQIPDYMPGSEEFLAHSDAPEVWSGDVLVSGGKHYGHLEVDVLLDANSQWNVTITPAYAFPVLSPTNPGEILGWERRTYDDSVTFVAVPEPTGLVLLATAALVAAFVVTKRAGWSLQPKDHGISPACRTTAGSRGRVWK